MKQEIETYQKNLEEVRTEEKDDTETDTVSARHEEICNALTELLVKDNSNAMRTLNLLTFEEKQWIEAHVSEIMNDLGIVTM